jgi:NitT/TauT family transport system permease protein
MAEQHVYSSDLKVQSRRFNRFDLLLVVFLILAFALLAQTGQKMAVPYALGQPISLSLSPWVLPEYALRTVLRMFIALFFSVLLSMLLGAWAAKNRRAEQIIIPAIDVLQAVPVLSFLALTVTGFIQLFPGSLLGPECACIFAIFTAQVWNIIFSMYQSLKMMPQDLKEAAAMFQLSAWQRFWRLELPFAIPSLLWNMMVSMSASWFIVVLSEAIAVAHQQIRLPGIGSYIAIAIEQRNPYAIVYAIICMVLVIFLYDQLLFRPLISWSEKFRMEGVSEGEAYQSRILDWLYASSLHEKFAHYLMIFRQSFIHMPWINTFSRPKRFVILNANAEKESWFWNSLMLLLSFVGMLIGAYYFYQQHAIAEVGHVFFLGAITAFRVLVLIILSSLIWIPIGVAIGLRVKLAQTLQPIIQFLAAFPANLFYPIFVIMIVKWQLNPEIFLTPLMILGTQWYILFNVIAGALMIPVDLKLLSANFQVKGWLWWRKLAIPAIFPEFLTGAVAAAGGAWNASIVAECVSWGNTTLHATGLGEYIQTQTLTGNFPKLMLGTLIMCFYVLIFNYMIWRPLYRFSQERLGSA